MTEKALVVKNTQALARYFPAYKRYFGYTVGEEPLSKEELEQRKQKLFGWVEKTKPEIDAIYQFIQSDHNASGFLPWYVAQKQKQTQSRQRIPFHHFKQSNVCMSCHQNARIQPNQVRDMRRQILQIKVLLDSLSQKHVVPPTPSTRRSTRVSSFKKPHTSK